MTVKSKISYVSTGTKAYIAIISDGVYHSIRLSDCDLTLATRNNRYYFGKRADAEKEGFVACESCVRAERGSPKTKVETKDDRSVPQLGS